MTKYKKIKATKKLTYSKKKGSKEWLNGNQGNGYL